MITELETVMMNGKTDKYQFRITKLINSWSVVRWPHGETQIPPRTEILNKEKEWVPVLAVGWELGEFESYTEVLAFMDNE